MSIPARAEHFTAAAHRQSIVEHEGDELAADRGPCSGWTPSGNPGRMVRWSIDGGVRRLSTDREGTAAVTLPLCPIDT